MVNSSSRTTRERSFHLQSSLDFEEVHRRLRTEHGPAAHPESEILGALAEVDKDIDEVNKEVEDCEFEIHRLQSRIIFLRNHHRCLEEHKACLRFLRSPIRKIPNETLLRIFGFSCDENELTSKKLSTMPALSISGVCARWRNLMKDFPNLWSRIRIETQTAPSKHLNLPILDLYLERSRQSPLIVNITGMVSTLQPHHSAICVTLATHSNHWKQLTVWSSKIYNELNRTLHSQKPPHFLMLEELILPTLTFNAPDALDRYQNAPNLISLSLGIIPLVNLASGGNENPIRWM
ncbi:hypothetical protein BT96DRAFT_690896 [Gymnopus androsaceus JB14]|uniref:Uncharacterized protein n=1 Tax=Gymnopus androsaceus JB14 TaxID=1447944 RepID=A0A6A4HPS8_9AGAR|nr:hypothetical protein BT96DRAFT_690896 [Gymnopus androsaceus JB14]